jgi:hypothetical protein
MELDDLKEYLKNRKEEATGVDKSSEKLSLLLKSNPKSPVNKMTRNLFAECIFTIVLIVLMIYGIATIKIWVVRTYLCVVIVVCFVFIIPYFGLYKKITGLNDTVLPVKKNLEEVYETMTAFVKMCFKFTTWMIPLFFIVAGSLGYYQGKTESIPQIDKYLTHFHNLYLIVGVTVAYFAIVLVGMFYFTKWYLKKLYGRYLDELKDILKDLEE